VVETVSSSPVPCAPRVPFSGGGAWRVASAFPSAEARTTTAPQLFRPPSPPPPPESTAGAPGRLFQFTPGAEEHHKKKEKRTHD
jgi:hypothetical protein